VFIAEHEFRVTQNGVSCNYSINPLNRAHSWLAATGTVAVAVATPCYWTAVSEAPWLTVVSGTNGNGSNTVRYALGANLRCSARTGTLAVAGQRFTVNQAGRDQPIALNVDPGYAGGNSDGSPQRPFRTVTDAYQAACSGDTLRIAAGDYPEAITNMNKILVMESTNGVVDIGTH
jgi:hypothetical protein